MHCLDLVWQDCQVLALGGQRVKAQEQKTQPTLRLSTSVRLHKQMPCGPDAVGTKSERQRIANYLQHKTRQMPRSMQRTRGIPRSRLAVLQSRPSISR